LEKVYGDTKEHIIKPLKGLQQ